jgi:superfamily II DNA or RNA helicase
MEEPPQPSASPTDAPGHSFSDFIIELEVTLDLAAGTLLFEWKRLDPASTFARGLLAPEKNLEPFLRFTAFTFQFEPPGIGSSHHCGAEPASTYAMLRRVRSKAPDVTVVRVGLLPDSDFGPAKAGQWHLLAALPVDAGWKWLGRLVTQYAQLLEAPLARDSPSVDPGAFARQAIRLIASAQLGIAPDPAALEQPNTGGARMPTAPQLFDLRVVFDLVEGRTELRWSHPDTGVGVADGLVFAESFGRLRWVFAFEGKDEPPKTSPMNVEAVRGQLDRWFERFTVNRSRIAILWKKPQRGTDEPRWEQEPPFGPNESPYSFIESNLIAVGEAEVYRKSPLGRVAAKMEQARNFDFDSYLQRMKRREEKRAEEEARRRETNVRLAAERRARETERASQQAAIEAKKTAAAKAKALATAGTTPRTRAPVPPVPVSVRPLALEFQETAFPLTDLTGFALRERAALWWVSNQSDDLLCLPHCRIERLEYQVRTALRVLGPLRGRALLSDEVGLGKTIEAGLITKELLTRGLVKRFLVLTLPSLVDQWAEELEEKFGLPTVTTNQAIAREDPDRFWRENSGIVASLHTLKQPAQHEIARQLHWDMLIVDEAHYLRNRTSQAWQAVNALPRQFLLLLTATPVQNSLEELYNLVTLLQPGQLPSPKEFRTRFLDPQRPRQPREPEELRRLLGQVMIRNTRANAGIELPPRQAETVVFAPDPAEAEFWRGWETDFRARLSALSAGQASLWGRLLLQAAGSSPAAWRAALEKFPDSAAARAWREQAPLEASWRRKCELLLPLTRGENGAVVFTQFLATQAALADFLRGAGVATFVINGSTPATERQPITEEFHRRGGALLLTHSGTEGRNLQFCRTLANFDLPWNPMEIEQRIGRLHRLGQRHPVSIYNFVQAGTLQEHLLEVLQEKLNLFELVVGETGLVLGERFSGDEFEEEIFRRWQTSDGKIGEAIAGFGEELAAARNRHQEVKQLDATLFAQDFESS